MIIISHRGYWKHPAEKNRDVAFRRSFELGWGTETDVRDHNGELVISHDMPNGTEITLSEFLKIFAQRQLPLAINVKADGLALPLAQTMLNHSVKDWFVFDMAIPDTRAYLSAGIPVFARMSEVEREPAWQAQSAGIWLDAFNDTWYDAELVRKLIESGKRVCVVSPELHGRDYMPLWEMLRPLSPCPSLMICTDYPELAQEFFGK